MSQLGTLKEVSLPVRWVVLFTGSKATEDYQPAASAAESPALVREVTAMCVAFHPHTDIRHFPQDSDAILFWRANATQDWVVTRVSVAPNPGGLRTALEYCSLVFTDAEFAKIGRNPFHARALHLHEKVRQKFLSESMEPFDFDLTNTTVVVNPGVILNGQVGAVSPPANGSLSTVENYDALRNFCAYAEQKGETPPTFATWWSSHGDPPAGAFDIALRAAPPKPFMLREALAEVRELNGDMKDSLPGAPLDDTVAGELSRSLITKSDMLVSAMDSIAARSNVDSVDVYQASMGEAAGQAGQIAADIERFRSRLSGKADDGDLNRLTALGARFLVLSKELTKVPHPDPFRPVDNTITKQIPPPRIPKTTTLDATASRPPSGGGVNPLMIGGAALAVVAVAGALMMSNKKPTPPPATPKASAGAGKTATPDAKPTTPAETADPLKEALKTNLEAAQKLAEASAQKATRQRTAEGDKPSPGEIRQTTFRAIRDAYRTELTSSEYDKIFDGPNAWDYDRFDRAFPRLTTEVKNAAEKGVLEGDADRKLKESQREINAMKAQQDQLAKEKANAEKRAEEERQRAAEARNRPTPSPRRPSRTSEDRPRPSRPRSRNSGEGTTKSPPKSSGGGVGSTDL